MTTPEGRSVDDVLAKLRANDGIYQLEGFVHNLHASQALTKQIILPERTSIIIDRTQTDSEEGEEKRKRTKKTKRTEKKEVSMHYFERDKDGNIMIQWGGPYGIFDTAVARLIKDIRELSFMAPPHELLWVEPQKLNLGKFDNIPVEIMSEKRYSNRPGRPFTQADVAYEVINAPVHFTLRINSVAKVGSLEIANLLHGLEGAKIGPTKRGRYEHISCKAIQE